MVNLTNALKIEGWMALTELTWLAEHAAPCKTVVEVGSWMGRSTRAMAESGAGTVHAIDTWQGSAEHVDILKDKPEGWLMARFLKNMEGVQNVRAHQMTSLAAAEMWQKARFDMVFLDASHDYESVKADILAWRPLVAGGGLLCGHDYNWTEVGKAVRELIPDVSSWCSPGWDDASIWYTTIAEY